MLVHHKNVLLFKTDKIAITALLCLVAEESNQ